MAKTSNVEREISKGGGVRARALIVGPRQDRWLMLLERTDRDEVVAAVRSVVRRTSSVENAAAHLNVEPAFLERYGQVARYVGAGKLPPYSPPTTVEGAVRIIGALGGKGSGRGGVGRGAWRVEDLLDDGVSKKAALGAIERIIATCTSINDVAAAFGVTRMVLWKWRQRWPEVDALVGRCTASVDKSTVRLKLNGRRRLTLEQAVDLMRPHLPGKATEVAAAIRKAALKGGAPHGVVPTARELSHYVQKPDARGLMVSRWRDRRGEQIVKVWALVDTKTGERLDRKGKHDDRDEVEPKGRPRGLRRGEAKPSRRATQAGARPAVG